MDSVFMRLFWNWLGNAMDENNFRGLLHFCLETVAEYSPANCNVPACPAFSQLFHKYNFLRCTEWAEREIFKIFSDSALRDSCTCCTCIWSRNSYEWKFGKTSRNHCWHFEPLWNWEAWRYDVWREPNCTFEVHKRKNMEILEVQLDSIAILISCWMDLGSSAKHLLSWPLRPWIHVRVEMFVLKQ